MTSTLKALNQMIDCTPSQTSSYSYVAIIGENPRPRRFSTKERRPFLREKPLRDELHHYIGGILGNLDCVPIITGGVEDHVHFLCALSRTAQPAEVVKEIKRGSSLWIKTKSNDLRDFAWQSGYGMFSIGYSQIESARKYIGNQEEHHRNISFQDELREILKRYDVQFDERYVWD